MKKTLFIIPGICAVFLLSICRYFIVPDVAFLKNHNPAKTSFIKFREHEWAKKHRNTRATLAWASYDHISNNLVKAVIIAEDAKFWNHEGFDFESIQNAIQADIKAKKFKLGGSTISQQLAKNLYLGPSKNPIRKIEEAILTWRLERNLSKRRILEIYLNVVEWGDGIFGIENAAQHYFGKSAADLDPKEASRLAAVLPNPIKFNPLSDTRYVVRRSGLIYKIMGIKEEIVQDYEKNSASLQDTLNVTQDSTATAVPQSETTDSLPDTVIFDSASAVPDTSQL